MKRKAFTLVELLVVIAIIGILVGMLFPAIQAVREAARRSSCSNNQRQLALALQNYESANKKFPYGRKYDIWDTYTWTQHILPYIEQQNVYDNYITLNDSGYFTDYPGPNGPIGPAPELQAARTAVINTFICPSDFGPAGNELDQTWFSSIRGNYRGSVGSGDMYGNQIGSGDPGPWGTGMFAVNEFQTFDNQITLLKARFADFKDGTSNTIIISEGLVPHETGWGGPMGSILYGVMGGSLYSHNLTPNSSSPDEVYGKVPSEGYTAPCVEIAPAYWWNQNAHFAHAAARSAHPGGVLAARADGSVAYYANDISQVVWRGLGTMKNGEIPQEQF